MKSFTKLFYSLILASISMAASASPIFTIGGAVTIESRIATFDSLGENDPLASYSEDGLFITVDDTNTVDHPAFGDADSRTAGFHYGSGGNSGEVSIRGIDGATFAAIDFLLGNGYHGQSMYFRFRTYLDGVETGSGLFAGISAGTIGISDASGFDELRVAADIGNPFPGFGGFQAIALDDVRAQVIDAEAPVDVPEPGSIMLLGAGLAGVLVSRRRKS